MELHYEINGVDDLLQNREQIQYFVIFVITCLATYLKSAK